MSETFDIIKEHPAYITNMMFEPFVEYEGEMINVNSISRCYRAGGQTMIEVKGRTDTLVYHSFDLFDLIKAKLQL